MKRLTLCLCGSIFVFPALGERIQSPQLPDTLTVAVLPEGPYSPLAIREMTREVASIMRRSGLRLNWHVGFGQQEFDEPLAVVKLAGTCGMEMPVGANKLAPSGKPAPLGWTHSVDGKLLPFSQLACDDIRRALESAMHADDSGRGNALLGRAMGRVLAHELFHILAATRKHTDTGISKAALSPADLISDRMELDSEGLELIQERLHGSR